jgi:hypothetical protein
MGARRRNGGEWWIDVNDGPTEMGRKIDNRCYLQTNAQEGRSLRWTSGRFTGRLKFAAIRTGENDEIFKTSGLRRDSDGADRFASIDRHGKISSVCCDACAKRCNGEANFA